MHIFYKALFISIIVFIGFSCTEQKYPSGRDTVESFGDGRFQILWAPSKIKALHDGQTQETIVKDVKIWSKEGEFLYIVGTGEQLFTVLNYTTADVQQFSVPDKIPDNYKRIYKKLIE